jgi:TPR repeat protein
MDQDYSKALELFEASTKADNVAGLINLALMRFRGLGCERDPKAAFSLLDQASELGSEQAKQLLKEWRAQEANPNK